MSSFVLYQDIIDGYNKDGAVLIKGKNKNTKRQKYKHKQTKTKTENKTGEDTFKRLCFDSCNQFSEKM